jgi:hypothetical protein
VHRGRRHKGEEGGPAAADGNPFIETFSAFRELPLSRSIIRQKPCMQLRPQNAPACTGRTCVQGCALHPWTRAASTGMPCIHGRSRGHGCRSSRWGPAPPWTPLHPGQRVRGPSFPLSGRNTPFASLWRKFERSSKSGSGSPDGAAPRSRGGSDHNPSRELCSRELNLFLDTPYRRRRAARGPSRVRGDVMSCLAAAALCDASPRPNPC